MRIPRLLPLLPLAALLLAGCINFESSYEGPEYESDDDWGAAWEAMMVFALLAMLGIILVVVLVALLGGGALFAVFKAAESSQPPPQDAPPAAAPTTVPDEGDQVKVTPPDERG